MNDVISVPLIALRLLANRKGKLSAVRLDLGPGNAEGLTGLTEQEDFRTLAGRFPCIFHLDDGAALPPPLVESWKEAGCQPVSRASIERIDHLLKTEYGHEVEWIDGNWYLMPPAKLTGGQAASRAVALQLVQLVAADADNREIEAVFRRDPTLSYHLLRLVNSLGAGAGRRITSFSQAIVILGRLQLRRWLNLMLFAARDGDHRSSMLLARVAARARTMELLARASGLDNALQEQAFMTGMFSMLGTLFGMPIEEVLRPLAIGEAMRGAVLMRAGELGQLLQLVEAAEESDFAALDAALAKLRLAHAEFNLAA
ncbi:MAG: HDOD domain-containing protein, partial [Burkholderiaceae bacterium]|nr:HDOD domain-containing protein [Burkholderiaceae bacterium]